MSQVEKRFIIVKDVDMAPLVKTPTNTDDGMIDMLKELSSLYPNAVIMTAEIAYGNQLWVNDGSQIIAMDEDANKLAVTEDANWECPECGCTEINLVGNRCWDCGYKRTDNSSPKNQP